MNVNTTDIKFIYSKTGDNQNKYHIFCIGDAARSTSGLKSLCSKIKNAATSSLSKKKPNDDDICLDCYGAQIDLEDNKNENHLGAVFMSSRGDNINISEMGEFDITVDKGIETNVGDTSTEDDSLDFPDLIELQRKQELEYEQKINRGDAASVAYNKQKDDTDTRRTDILVRSLQVKIDKKRRILQRTDISKTLHEETQQSLDNAIVAKTVAEIEIIKRNKNRPKKVRSTVPVVRTRPVKRTIRQVVTKKKPQSPASQPLVAKPLVAKPTVRHVKKIRGERPIAVVLTRPEYKPDRTLTSSTIQHVINRNSCTVKWVERGEPVSKVYEYRLNKGRKRAIDRMRREYPLHR